MDAAAVLYPSICVFAAMILRIIGLLTGGWKSKPTISDIHPCGGVANRQQKNKIGRNLSSRSGHWILLRYGLILEYIWLRTAVAAALIPSFSYSSIRYQGIPCIWLGKCPRFVAARL